MPNISDENTNAVDGRKSKCKTCDLEECFMKNSKGISQKCTTKWIGCDLCKDWFHGICQGLQTAEVSFLDKMDKKGVKWYCDTCIEQIEMATKGDQKANLDTLAENTNANSKLKSIEEMISNIVTTLNTSNAALNNRMDHMESSYAAAVKSNTEGVQKSIEINSSARHLLARNIEQSQADSRKKNAILYGIQPEEGKSAIDQVNEMLSKVCFTHTKQPIKAIRLQTTGASTTKPIKLEFDDENTKWEFLKRVNDTQRGEKIFCKLDESKEVRNQQYELRQQIKKMKSANTESNMQYRIRNMRIETKEESGEWQCQNKLGQPSKSHSSNTTV